MLDCAELGKGAGLPGPLTQVPVQLQRAAEGGLGGGVVVGEVLHVAKVGQCAGLVELAAGVAGGAGGGGVQRQRLVPMPLAAQELVHRGGDRRGVGGPAGGGGVTAEPARAARPQLAAPAAEPAGAEVIEVTFTPAEPQLTPGAARGVLALLLAARDRAQASDRAESGRT